MSYKIHIILTKLLPTCQLSVKKWYVKLNVVSTGERFYLICHTSNHMSPVQHKISIYMIFSSQTLTV